MARIDPFLEQQWAEAMALRNPRVSRETVAPGAPGIPPTMVTEQREVTPSPIDALYGELDLFNQQPVDYSALDTVNQGRKAQSQRDLAAGMALQAFGGSRLAPAGGQLFRNALAGSQPLRPNAADIGWTNPETGEFVQNPMMERARREKLLTGRIDAMTAEQQAQARIAEAQERRAATDFRNQEVIRQRQERLEFDREKAEAEANRKAGKPLAGLVSMNDGGPVRLGPDGGYVDTQGNPTQVINAAGYQKRQNDIRGAEFGSQRLEQIVRDVEKNKDAFGIGPGLISKSPWLATKALSEPQRMARIQVYQEAYKAINALAGAALSAHEQQRINQFLPEPMDTYSQVKLKIQNAIGEYEKILAEHGVAPPTVRQPLPSQQEGYVDPVEALGGKRVK